MTDKLQDLASGLQDIESLRLLLSELNFDYEDEPVNNSNWTDEEIKLVECAKIVAKKHEYLIFYIRTETSSLKVWKGIASKIIKKYLGHCIVCSHSPKGIKWVFSSLSKEFSKSFSETRHISIDINPQSKAPKPFVEFLEKIRVAKNSSTASIMAQVSDAFDKFAIQIHDELTVNVFEALKRLSEGILTDRSNKLVLDEQTLKDIREPVFILLYRIMFVLYAEDRGVFPDTNNIYHDKFSIKWMKSEWILKQPNVREYQVYKRLKDLFRLIEVGSEGLDYDPDEFCMRSYYGRLFDKKIHQKLDKWKIPNKMVLEALSLLTRTRDKQGNWFFLDYAALETRHLGAIYERLLEYHLAIRDGQIADLPNPKERKTTGSYYTPQYIVDYIVENTVGPLIDNIVKKTPPDRDPIEQILNLNILDPAMGSGHFLVGVVNYMARRICEIEGAVSEDEFTERKRDVARRCVYGVDLNPLAADLAAVSLWLETLSSERPLSFLSAHLKSGNSLIGSTIDNILDKQTTLTETTQGRKKFKKTIKDFNMMEELEDDSPAAVKTKIEKYADIKRKGTVYHDLKFLLDAKVAQSFGVDVPPLADYAAKIGQNSLDFYAEGGPWQEAAKTAAEHQFFHWDLEFPGIFYGPDGLRKENPGFDAVVGNPPYGRYGMLTVEQKSFLKLKNLYSKTGDVAEVFINQALIQHLKTDGLFSFIVPKGLTYVKSWINVRRTLLYYNIKKIIDASKAFEDVLYEQMVFLIQKNTKKDAMVESGVINAKTMTTMPIFLQHFNDRIFPMGLDRGKFEIGQKLVNQSDLVKNCMSYWYGKGGLTPKINQDGKGVQLLTGKEIMRYGSNVDVKPWFLDPKHLNDQDLERASVEKVVVQDIVAHITTPTPHIKLTASLDTKKRFCLNTVMCFSTNGGPSNRFLVALLNSKLMSFYFYFFIFNQSIRTMHFMPGYADYIPIPKNFRDFQNRLDAKCDVMINYTNKIQTLEDCVHARPLASEPVGRPGSRIGGGGEVYKTVQTPKVAKLQHKLEKTSNEINQLVYDMYNLNDQEIKIVEKHVPS